MVKETPPSFKFYQA